MSALTSSELEQVSDGVRWLAQVDLEPGAHQLRVAARALATGTSGTATLMSTCRRSNPSDLDDERRHVDIASVLSRCSRAVTSRSARSARRHRPRGASISGDQYGGGRSLCTAQRPASSPYLGAGRTSRSLAGGSGAGRWRAEMAGRAPMRSRSQSTPRSLPADGPARRASWILGGATIIRAPSVRCASERTDPAFARVLHVTVVIQLNFTLSRPARLTIRIRPLAASPLHAE